MARLLEKDDLVRHNGIYILSHCFQLISRRLLSTIHIIIMWKRRKSCPSIKNIVR